jgi:plasmid stabilization system protein ParE
VIYWLHPDAEAELANAADYYAEHANVAIAHAFVTEFERVAAMLLGNQQLGTRAGEGLRTYPFKRFPYLLVYREDAGGPRVFAVAHQHR